MGGPIVYHVTLRNIIFRALGQATAQPSRIRRLLRQRQKISWSPMPFDGATPLDVARFRTEGLTYYFLPYRTGSS